ncbi:fumarylacetoacetate hydrolase family protein [Atopomonas sediminilitoris]|uniref:fumarylacetoacetate hydrolase family protein n=1 Tax=Atopomonas sediminilitoris TaxID=2919919 RepID=UPI001F4E6F44|nr:fumarylacetoacetate hydrolase family protein [Atopomonas sediminilitoris]MCJ8170414.1 fumarylacetoacetate hydrolase family protein [Atopomonas sediminilitoris]
MSYQHQYTDGALIHFPLGKVVCVGRNYAEHAKELNNPIPTEPLLFIKPATAVVSLSQGVCLPQGRSDVHHEAEIAVLIGKPLAHKVSAQEAREAIVGIGAALDLTLRDLQSKLKEKGHPWEVAKAFDGACPLTGFVAPECFEDLADIPVSLTVNGQLRQQGNSAEMLTPILPLLQYIAQHFTLLPGDVVLTGTPAGVAALAAGDQLTLALGDVLSATAAVR